MELDGYGSESSASSSLGEVAVSVPPADRYPVSYAGKCHQTELHVFTPGNRDKITCTV